MKFDDLVQIRHYNRIATGWILEWTSSTEFIFQPNTDTCNKVNAGEIYFCKTDYWHICGKLKELYQWDYDFNKYGAK